MTTHTESYWEDQAKQLLFKNLLSLKTVDEKELNLLLDHFEPVSCKKNQVIISEGEKNRYFYFIYKGITRIYFYKNKKLVIERFEKEGGFFGINFSHIINMPGIHNYQAIEDVELLRIRHVDFGELCNKYHSIESLYRINLELLHANYVKRFYTFASLSSEEKYYQFLIDYGDITNRLPLKYVANYLGMTSETLSRIRANKIS